MNEPCMEKAHDLTRSLPMLFDAVEAAALLGAALAKRDGAEQAEALPGNACDATPRDPGESLN